MISGERSASAFASRADDWPRTGRVLPWLIALLAVMICLTPFDTITLPIPLPFDAKLDRPVLFGCFAIWALVVAVRTERPQLAHRYGLTEVLLVVFALVCIASVVGHGATLSRLGEANRSTRQLIVIVSYVAFFLFVVNNLRPTEVPAFAKLVVGLTSLTALGTIIEYRTGYNAFYSVASALAPPGVAVPSHAFTLTPSGRPAITGPARHGLAVSTMLAMVLPLALTGLLLTRSWGRRALYGAAALLLFVGALVTLRRSGVVLPVVTSLSLVIFGGRRARPLLVILVVGVVASLLLAPGAISQVRAQLSGNTVEAQQSLQSRTSAYPAVVPDLRNRFWLGRGFASYDPNKYRFLDNAYLGLLVQTGVLGTGAYLALILAPAGLAITYFRRRVRAAVDDLAPEEWLLPAAAAAMVGFLVASVLYDALDFPHAPYLFLVFVAFAARLRRLGDAPVGAVEAALVLAGPSRRTPA